MSWQKEEEAQNLPLTSSGEFYSDKLLTLLGSRSLKPT